MSKLGLQALIANNDQEEDRTPAEGDRATQLQKAVSALPGLFWGVALGPVAVALLCWIYQRLLYSEMVKAWRAAAARQQALDATSGLVRAGLDPSVRSRLVLLEVRKQAYAEVVRPLEPYISVIFLFSIPQIVGVTQRCQIQTSDAYSKGLNGDVVSLPCEPIVQFVMAFRPIALAVVYLWDARVRAEAFDIPDAWRRLRNRRGGGGRGGGVRFPANELDGVALVPTDESTEREEREGRPTSLGRADADIKRMGSMASKRLAEMSVADQDGGPMDPVGSQIPYQLME